MRRLPVIAVLCAALLSSGAAVATTVPRPIPTKLYFHGTEALGEIDNVNGTVGAWFMRMDAKKPESPAPRSVGYGWGNTRCVGNHFFPVWVGNVSGTIVGDLKVIFESASYPQDVDIRVWAGVNQAYCNNDYFEPSLSTSVTLPPGKATVTAVLKNSRLRVRDFLMVQISPTQIAGDTPGFGRVLYDSPDAPSRVEFRILP